MKTADNVEITVGLKVWRCDGRDGAISFSVNTVTKISDQPNVINSVQYERGGISGLWGPPSALYAIRDNAVARLMELVNAME